MNNGSDYCSNHRKKKKQDSNNCHGIVLLKVAYTVFLNCKLSRIKKIGISFWELPVWFQIKNVDHD